MGILEYLIRQTLSCNGEEELKITRFRSNLPGRQTLYYDCPHCNKEVRRYYRFCPYCERPLKGYCVKCHASIEFEYNACPYCGAKVTVTVKSSGSSSIERRNKFQYFNNKEEAEQWLHNR